jgi:hypothetical protein
LASHCSQQIDLFHRTAGNFGFNFFSPQTCHSAEDLAVRTGALGRMRRIAARAANASRPGREPL